MPFRSKAQQGYLFAKHPDVAKRFASETPKDAYHNLPEHVKRKKRKNHAHMLAAALRKK